MSTSKVEGYKWHMAQMDVRSEELSSLIEGGSAIQSMIKGMLLKLKESLIYKLVTLCEQLMRELLRMGQAHDPKMCEMLVHHEKA